MDTYLFLAAAAIVELFIAKEPLQRWSRSGLTQASAWIVAAILVLIALLFGLLQLTLIFVIALFLGLGLFLARIGRLALMRNPLRGGVESWMFFGTLWLVVYTIIFSYAAFVFLPNPASIPPWFFTVFVHTPMVGMMTVLLLGLYSARARDAQHVLRWGEALALWLLNLGILVFFLLKIFADVRLGALVMGAGVLLGVFTMISRLLSSERVGAPTRGPAT